MLPLCHVGHHVDVPPFPSSSFDSALRASVSQDLTALKRRQQQVAHQCSSLAERWDKNSLEPSGDGTPLYAMGDCVFSSAGPRKLSNYNRTISSNGERGLRVIPQCMHLLNLPLLFSLSCLLAPFGSLLPLLQAQVPPALVVPPGLNLPNLEGCIPPPHHRSAGPAPLPPPCSLLLHCRQLWSSMQPLTSGDHAAASHSVYQDCQCTHVALPPSQQRWRGRRGPLSMTSNCSMFISAHSTIMCTAIYNTPHTCL